MSETKRKAVSYLKLKKEPRKLKNAKTSPKTNKRSKKSKLPEYKLSKSDRDKGDIKKYDPYINENGAELPTLHNLVNTENVKETIQEFKKTFYERYFFNKKSYPTSEFKSTRAASFLNDKKVPEILKHFIVSSEMQQKSSARTKKSMYQHLKNLLFELETYYDVPAAEIEDKERLEEFLYTKSTEDLLLDIKNSLPEFNSFIGFAPLEFREFSVKTKVFPTSPIALLSKRQRTKYDVMEDIKKLVSLLKTTVPQPTKKIKHIPCLENKHKELQGIKQNAPLLLSAPVKKGGIKDILDDLKHFLPDIRTSCDGRFPEEEWENYLQKGDNLDSMFTPPPSRQEKTTEDVLEDIKGLIPELLQMQSIIKNVMNKENPKALLDSKAELPGLPNSRPSTPVVRFLQKDIGLEKISQVKEWLKRRNILINRDLSIFPTEDYIL